MQLHNFPWWHQSWRWKFAIGFWRSQEDHASSKTLLFEVISKVSLVKGYFCTKSVIVCFNDKDPKSEDRRGNVLSRKYDMISLQRRFLDLYRGSNLQTAGGGTLPGSGLLNSGNWHIKGWNADSTTSSTTPIRVWNRIQGLQSGPPSKYELFQFHQVPVRKEECLIVNGSDVNLQQQLVIEILWWNKHVHKLTMSGKGRFSLVS